MWMIPNNVSIHLYTQPTDMRFSFDRLAAMVYQAFGREATDGNLYVFANRRGDRMKVLYWDASGYALWYKHLQAGTFRLPTDRTNPSISAAELALILEGLEAKELQRRKRFRLPS
jgi:transposase